MAKKNSPIPRCSNCQFHLPLCLCSDLLKVNNQTKITFLVHNLEKSKLTNTSRLAHNCLQNFDKIIYGEKNQPITFSAFNDKKKAAILYPFDHAEVISFGPKRYDELIILDGSWKQAHKMGKNFIKKSTLPFVRLPDNVENGDWLRKQNRPGQMCSFVALAQALGILEGASIERALLQNFSLFMARHLWARGKKLSMESFQFIPSSAKKYYRQRSLTYSKKSTIFNTSMA